MSRVPARTPARSRRHRDFAEAVYRIVRRIPRGRVVTYGQIAALIGEPRAAHAVGQAMRAAPSDLPWHRVVNARGEVPPRRGPVHWLDQHLRLEQEGLRFTRGRLDLGRYRWRGPGTTSRAA